MKNVFAAIAACKKELGNTIQADSQGQYDTKFASLAAVLHAVESAAAKNGILILQGPTIIDNKPGFMTTVAHVDSSEVLEWKQLLITDKPGPQGLGASETYAKRRMLMSIFGLATGDDPDFNQAAQHSTQYQPSRGYPQSERPSAPKPTSRATGSLADKKIGLFKKFIGKTYGQVSMDELAKSAMWLKEQSMKDGKPMGRVAEEFIADVHALQNEFESSFATPSDEHVPF